MSKKTEKENRPVDEQEKKDAIQDTETPKPDDSPQDTGNPTSSEPSQQATETPQDAETPNPDDDSQETGNPPSDEKDGARTATTQNPSSDEKDGDNDVTQNPESDKTKTKADASRNPSCKKRKMMVRHKSILPNYYRAGLRFTKEFAEYEVPCDKVDTIKNDVWLEVKETK